MKGWRLEFTGEQCFGIFA